MENWYALAVCILNPNFTIDKAVEYFYSSQKRKYSDARKPKSKTLNAGCKRKRLNEEKVKSIYDMYLQGTSYSEISKKFGTTSEAIRLKIYRYKKKLEGGQY